MPNPIWSAFRQSSSRNFLLCLFSFLLATGIGSVAQRVATVSTFIGSNGYLPTAGLTQGPDGNFYGTTFDGGVGNGSSECAGTQGCGSVFKVTPGGTLTSLYSFCSQTNCTDGSYPYGGLALGPDGNLYGTTESGGTGCQSSGGCGTIFKITPSGTLTTLHSFCTPESCQDGDAPATALLLASDGNFYGVAYFGGLHGFGNIFKMTPSGTLTTIYSFCSLPGCTDGSLPVSALIQATDGNLYGTTSKGGSSGAGTVFRITLAGAMSILHNFDGTQAGGPRGTLVQASDGNFYGTTVNGGGGSQGYCSPSGCGTVFRMTPGGAFTVLHNFFGPDGAYPTSGLLLARDGNLYGTVSSGGIGCQSDNCGTIFRITTAGQMTTLFDFNSFDGASPWGALMQAPDGGLYGATGGGGGSRTLAGTIFRMTLPLQFVPLTPCRLVDTRQTGNPIQGGTVRDVNLQQQTNCVIPATAAAYSLNVTAVPHGSLRYLTIWTGGESQPPSSTMNSLDGRTKANAAVVASINNAVSVYATDTTDLVLDINGYFAPPAAQTLEYYPLTPCRLVDTRQADGPLGGPRLEAEQERDFPLLMSNCIPAGVNLVAYSLNVTAVPNPQHQQVGYLTLWPAGQPQPGVSTLNNPTATTVANATIAAAGSNGEVAVYTSDSTDLLIDINGYFAPAGIGGYSLYAVVPCRPYDSRRSGGHPFSGERMMNINYGCDIPNDATGYLFNATVVPTGGLGYLTVWPDREGQPAVSTLNAMDGAITSNMAIVPTLDCCTDVFAAGYTHLIVDLSGYFAQ